MPRTGRRPGIGGTRDKILAAARARFGEEGYDGATIRGIASAAGVDPAMVPHYFGSKEGVFLAAVEFPVDPAVFIPRLLEPGLDGLGERLVSFFLETWVSSWSRCATRALGRRGVAVGELADTIAGFALFADLTTPQRENVVDVFTEQWFADEEKVLRQGFSGSGLYIVIDGAAAIRIDGVDRATLRAGDYFGEISCLLGEAPTADIVAIG